MGKLTNTGVLSPDRRASGGARKQLQVRTLVTRDTSWQQNGMVFSIVPDEGDYTGHIIKGQCMHWKPSSVAMHPGCNAILTAALLDIEELVLLGVMKEEKGTQTYTLALVVIGCP